MNNTPLLTTERLILRQFTVWDSDALYAILSDREVNTFLPMFPLQTLQETGQYLQEHILNQYDAPSGYQYAVCLNTDDIPIGYVHVSNDKSHDLGYCLGKKFWNKGIITEACEAVIGQLKKDGLPYITATHDRNNPRSGAVMQKLGMIYRYTYEELWQPKNYPVTFRMYQMNFTAPDDFVYREYWDRYSVRLIEAGIEISENRSITDGGMEHA